MSPEPPTPQQEPTHLTTAEAAQRLGLSIEAVRELAASGKFQPDTFKDARGYWRIPVVAVNEWLLRDQDDRRLISLSVMNQPPGEPQTQQSIEQVGPPTWWERFRHHPWVFYPTIAFAHPPLPGASCPQGSHKLDCIP